MTLWQKLACTLITTWLAFSSVSVRAEFIVSIDLDPAFGIQPNNLAPVNINDEITATIVMEMTAPSNIRVYEFSISFGNGLEYVGRTELHFGSLDQHLAANNVSNGIASGFDAGMSTAGSYSTPTTDPVAIGTLTFKVIGSTNLRITPGLFDGGNFDLFVDGSDSAIPATDITFNFGEIVNITAVPEPSSIVLLALASLGLLARYRMQLNRAIKAC